MARKYDSVWAELKMTGSVEVTVSKDAARTVENGVKEAKTIENTARKSVGLIGWSKLVITRTELSPTHLKLRFEFLYSTAI